MRTVSEIADLTGVTSQAIYKWIRTDHIPGLTDYISKNTNDIMVISPEGVELIKKHIQSTTTKEQTLNTDTYIEDLKKHIETLETQLEIKDTQIEQLNDRLKESLRLNENNQILIAEKLGLLDRVKRLFVKG